MKTLKRYLYPSIQRYILFFGVVFLLLAIPLKTTAQGKVIINEYLSWPNQGCSVTSEYIELYNFGPGPVNIGCYILTDGDYAITIPANTIILPGQYFVISGQDTLPMGCANITTAVVVNLNWNKINCTSAPIPTTGDGFMTDGGFGSEQLVLMKPNLTVIDAVVRQTPEPSSLITTNSNGGCGAVTFNLDNMNIKYETIGESQGRANSFARLNNGGCTWTKDPQQSAGGANNTTSSSTYTLSVSITQAISCTNNGAAVVYINTTSASTVFPISYLLSRDVDSNGVFDTNDEYWNGIDSTPNNIPLNNLKPGIYKIVTENASSCDLQMIQFNILDCNAVTLQNYFTNLNATLHNNETRISWSTYSNIPIEHFLIEASLDGKTFQQIDSVAARMDFTQTSYNHMIQGTGYTWFKIKMVTVNAKIVYSSITRIIGTVTNTLEFELHPNPAKDRCYIKIQANRTENGYLVVCDLNGRIIRKTPIRIQEGIQISPIDLQDIPKGIYVVKIQNDRECLNYKRLVKY